jgi:hypothetical protein
VPTKFDIYVYIFISTQQRVSGKRPKSLEMPQKRPGERLVTEGIIRPVFSVLTLTWFIKYMFNVKVILH